MTMKLIFHVALIMAAILTACRPSHSANKSSQESCHPITELQIIFLDADKMEQTRTVLLKEEIDAGLIASLGTYKRTIEEVTKSGKLIAATRLQRAQCIEDPSLKLVFNKTASSTAGDKALGLLGEGVNMSVYAGTDCSVTRVADALYKFLCPDGSAALYDSRTNEAALKTNSERSAKVLAVKAQAVTEMLARIDMLTADNRVRDAQISLVTGHTFDKIAHGISTAISSGEPDPELNALIEKLDIKPPTVATDEVLNRALRQQLQRATSFAKITNTSALSADQIQAFHKDFVQKTIKFDEAALRNSIESRTFATNEVNKMIEAFAGLNRASPSYNQHLAAYAAVFDNFAKDGLLEFADSPDLNTALNSIKLKTSLTSRNAAEREAAVSIRRSINTSTLVAQTHPGAAWAVDAFSKADTAYIEGNFEKSQRLVGQGEALLAYESGSGDLAGYRGANLSDRAKDIFSIQASAEHYLGYQTIAAANQLVKVDKIMSSPELRLQAFAAIHSIANADPDDLYSATSLIDNAWAIYDFAGGFTKGVGLWGYDTVTGAYQIVTHPLDSAESVAHSLINWGETWTSIKTQVNDTIDRYPEMTNAERGELHGRITAELGSHLVGMGAIKSASALTHLTAPIRRAVDKVAPRVIGGLRGYASVGANFTLGNVEKYFPGRSLNVYEDMAKIDGQITGYWHAGTAEGPLPREWSTSLTGGRHVEITLSKPLTLHRVWTDGGSGREFRHHWTISAPKGRLQATIDSAVLPEYQHVQGASWQTMRANRHTTIVVPSGTKIYVGESGPKGRIWQGGSTEVILPEVPTAEMRIGEPEHIQLILRLRQAS